MHGVSLHEFLARERRRYERLVYSRLKGSITWEDAEDIVSDAIVRAQRAAESELPAPGKEQAWFSRIALNQGIDFLRARDGRKRDGSTPRPAVIALSEVGDEGLQIGDGAAPGDPPGPEDLDEAAERASARAIVGRVMARLDPEDVELVRVRHLAGVRASRKELAALAGLTVGEFRWRYARAWGRFVEAVAMDAPTPRCETVRQLHGQVQAGTAPAHAHAEIDAHTLECASCRVFARDSYRALEMLPAAPAAGAVEHWVNRVACVVERSAPEATAGGATAAGAGIWGLLGGGGAAGTLKALAIVCGVTTVTAGVCGGVAAVLNELHRHPLVAEHPRQPRHRAIRTETLPRPVTLAASYTSPRRQVAAKRPAASQPHVDTSGESKIPGGAPAGSSEFTPSASSARVPPAPAPTSGGGEFSP